MLNRGSREDRPRRGDRERYDDRRDGDRRDGGDRPPVERTGERAPAEAVEA
jgi:hypothetical protein